MKKIYVIPTIQVCQLNLQHAMLLTGSLEADPDPDKTTVGGNGGWVKENEAPSYNVWDDDWRD
ncbi:MAG: hypothetical protein IKO12_03480 [Bacteroidaceae bacterium]|nr:hypothetical protein [Bacteroidaceae bacterium]